VRAQQVDSGYTFAELQDRLRLTLAALNTQGVEFLLVDLSLGPCWTGHARAMAMQRGRASGQRTARADRCRAYLPVDGAAHEEAAKVRAGIEELRARMEDSESAIWQRG
jgi:hypothetical protein